MPSNPPVIMRSSSLPTLLRILVLVPLAGCTPAARVSPLAQEAAFARRPGETLRYVGRTEYFDSRPGGDPERITSARNVRYAIAFTGGDTARAWIDAMTVERMGGVVRVDTAGPEVVGRPFTLVVDALGKDSVIAAPPLGWSEAPRFVDFFPPLPGGPLGPEKVWYDYRKVDTSDSLRAGEFTQTVVYHVEGDSTIRGTKVVVVEFDVRWSDQSRLRQPLVDPPPGVIYNPSSIQVRSGEEHGRFYFAPRTGRLVRRVRTGVETVETPSFTAPEASVFETRYRSTLELVDARR
jgi:hypothetical protein